MNSEQLANMRHSLAHILAHAVQDIYKDVKFGVGPVIDNGFYYDFDNPKPFTDKDLKVIQKEMAKIINCKLPVVREEVSREEAEKRIREINEPYKLEILTNIKQEPITIYHLGNQWWDLCAGPHLENTSEIDPKAIALESVAGVYWHGDETKIVIRNERAFTPTFSTAE